MEEQKEKTPVTAIDLQKAIKELLRNNIVGFVRETEKGVLTFTLPGGKTFEISVR